MIESKPKIPFDFGEHFQTQTLVLMLADINLTSKVIQHIPEERLFSDGHKYLFKIIQEKFKKDGSNLTYVEVEDDLSKIEPHKRKILKTFCKRVFATKLENPDFLKERLTDYAKKNAFIDVFQSGQTFWNSKKYDEAYQYTMEGINQLYMINFNDDANIPVEKFEEYRQIYVNESLLVAKKVPTNIDALDQVLRGGLEKGELGIMLAEPKKGKSISLVHFGCAALIMGTSRVVHFVLEGTTEQTILRYLSRLTGIEYRRLEKDEITDKEQKLIASLSKKYLGRLDLIPFNQHWNYTVLDIEAKLKELETAGRKPDLVVIDYADLLKSVDKGLEKRHEQTEVYRDIKRLAVMKKFAIWTASQARRPDKDEEVYILRSKDISESYEKVRIADIVCTINQTSDERSDGIIRLHIDIYRSADTDFTIRLITNYEKMIFHSKALGVIEIDKDIHTWMFAGKKRRK